MLTRLAALLKLMDSRDRLGCSAMNYYYFIMPLMIIDELLRRIWEKDEILANLEMNVLWRGMRGRKPFFLCCGCVYY